MIGDTGLFLKCHQQFHLFSLKLNELEYYELFVQAYSIFQSYLSFYLSQNMSRLPL